MPWHHLVWRTHVLGFTPVREEKHSQYQQRYFKHRFFSICKEIFQTFNVIKIMGMLPNPSINIFSNWKQCFRNLLPPMLLHSIYYISRGHADDNLCSNLERPHIVTFCGKSITKILHELINIAFYQTMGWLDYSICSLLTLVH